MTSSGFWSLWSTESFDVWGNFFWAGERLDVLSIGIDKRLSQSYWKGQGHA